MFIPRSITTSGHPRNHGVLRLIQAKVLGRLPLLASEHEHRDENGFDPGVWGSFNTSSDGGQAGVLAHAQTVAEIVDEISTSGRA